MVATFDKFGIRFRYPTNWAIEASGETDADAPDEWSVSVQSPATAFLVFTASGEAGAEGRVADEALETLRGEYPTLEAEAAVSSLAGQPAVGYDVNFLTLDVLVTCWLRCVATPTGTLLVLTQVGEYDRAVNEPVMQAICESLTVTED